ncbi:MAG TPA: O-antigen ligase family protein [Gemmatimonadaceae bacterium]|nr:O-antigen ligase family protein [Gemmatimonadaceae bacterium]
MTTPNRPIGAGLAGGGLWPAHIPRPAAPSAALPPVQLGAAATQALPAEVSTQRWPWRGVQWTLTYAGFLGYIFAITTYRFPIGDVSIVIALIGLLTMKEPVRVPGVLKGLGFFLLWGLIGYAMSDYPDLVYARLDQMVKLWLIALVAANALRTRAQVRFFLFFWLGCFALYPVRGALFNYYVYRETLFGRALWNYIFSNPNDLAAYCILQLSMALGLYSLEAKGPVRLGARLGLVVLPLVILLTKSRGAFLGFAGFLLFALWGQKRRGRAIGITVALAAALIFIAPSGVLDRVFALRKIQDTGDLAAADQEGSAEQRYEIWKVSRLVIRENPVAGVGLGAYPAEHQLAALRPQFKETARGRRDNHSTYLNVTAETGFVGLLIWVASYLSAFLGIEVTRRKLKRLRPASAQTLYALELGALGFFIAAIFGSMAHVSFLVLHVVTIWSIAELMKREVATGAAARRAQALHLANAGTPLPAAR